MILRFLCRIVLEALRLQRKIAIGIASALSLGAPAKKLLGEQPSCMHLVILTLSLAKGKNPQALRKSNGCRQFSDTP
jgi:hypothetical protein